MYSVDMPYFKVGYFVLAKLDTGTYVCIPVVCLIVW